MFPQHDFKGLEQSKRYDWATLFLGETYYDGTGCERDYEKAHEIFLFAAQNAADDRCAARAYYRAGYTYYAGVGNLIHLREDRLLKRTYPNYDEYKALAVKCWKEAARLGFHLAEDWLADCYFFGEAVEKNLAEAKRLYKSAASKHLESSKKKLDERFPKTVRTTLKV